MASYLVTHSSLSALSVSHPGAGAGALGALPGVHSAVGNLTSGELCLFGMLLSEAHQRAG